MTAPPSDRQLIQCTVCGRDVPPGEYCGACGAHLSSASQTRAHAFAAHPNEHLLHPGVTSTLFPHLPHRHAAPFRLALLAGVLLLLILGLLGLTGPAIAASALVVPLLYLLYLYEVDVYEDEPELVVGVTFVLGVIIGIPWANYTGHYITETLIQNVTGGTPLWRDVTFGVLLPLAAQLLMLVGAFILFVRGRYDEVLDGFTFAAAGALGFTLATTAVNLWPELQLGLTTSAPTVDNTLSILGRGLLVPFIAASTSGLLGGALWLARGRTRELQAYGWTTKLWSTILTVIAVWALVGLVNVFISKVVTVVAIYAAVSVVLLLLVRIGLHHMLLAESVDVTIGPDNVCFNCHAVVPRMAFCPHCGVATRATPKTAHGKLARAYR